MSSTTRCSWRNSPQSCAAIPRRASLPRSKAPTARTCACSSSIPAPAAEALEHAGARRAHADVRAAGHSSITVGAGAPYFLWPGVRTSETALICLLERHHYARVDTNFDMTIDLRSLPPDHGGHTLATPTDRDEIAAFASTHWSNWRAEVLRARQGQPRVLRDGQGVVRSAPSEVSTRGSLGPVAVRPDLIGRGAGVNALVGALHELRRRGRSSIEVVWVGPVVPYARLGGRVSSTYFVYRRAWS